ncbi:WD40 repeat domain-containing protein [Streptomyces sp. NBC_01571]|uniref:caspase, EACC1-associated type n=1 Tax=Streptomyces sp. NBC_01571 TaxID=2975883 RepID=UPI0022535991|nr:caspase family protein [Streptomyces sp. NBC_01571]MCX4571894.1 WD40 repeat domain-containing protein [Streptomyces sp. NBC_01571]
MTDRWFPDRSSSRVLLIGTGQYRNSELPAIEAVTQNLESLKQALTHPDVGLLDNPDHCRVVADPTDQASVGAALAWAVREAEGLLLVYYAGHGVLDDDGLLHLALQTTDPEHIGFSAVPMELVKRNLGRAGAKARVLLLDCCFSGRAVSPMAEPGSLLSGQLDLTGTYTLTSTTATAPSHAPVGAAHTAFTGALLHALAEPEPLTLDGIYEYVDRELSGLGLPRPQRRSVGGAKDLALVRGPVPAAGSAGDSGTATGRPSGEASFPMRYPTQIRGADTFAAIAFTVATFGVFWLLLHDVLRYGLLLPVWLLVCAGFYGNRTYLLPWRELVVNGEGLTAKRKDGSRRHRWGHIAALTLVDSEVPRPKGRTYLVVRLRPGAEANDEVHKLPSPAGARVWYLGDLPGPTEELLAVLRAYAPAGARVERKHFAVPPPLGTLREAFEGPRTTPTPPADPGPPLEAGDAYRGPRRRSALLFLTLAAVDAGSAVYLDRRNTPVTLSGHTDAVTSVRFNAPGTALASGSDDRTVKLWDPRTHGELKTLTGHESGIESVHFTDNYTVVSSDGLTVRIWDVNAVRPPVVLPTGWVGLRDDGALAAGPEAGDGNRLAVWEVRTGRKVTTLSGHTGRIRDCDWNASGTLLATCGDDGTVRVWDTRTWKSTATLRGHERAVIKVLFGPDGTMLISGGMDDTVRLWNGRASVATLTGHPDGISTLGFGDDGKTLYCTDGFGTVRLWNLATRQPTATVTTDSLVNGTAATSGGTLVLAQRGTLRLVDMSTGRGRTLPVPFLPWSPERSFSVNAVAVAPDSRTIAGGCDDDRIRLWTKSV